MKYNCYTCGKLYEYPEDSCSIFTCSERCNKIAAVLFRLSLSHNFSEELALRDERRKEYIEKKGDTHEK